MGDFNYKPMYPTREMTEKELRRLDAEHKALISDDDVFHAIEWAGIGHSLYMHVGHMIAALRRDLKYFDAIDRAMEEAVR